MIELLNGTNGNNVADVMEKVANDNTFIQWKQGKAIVEVHTSVFLHQCKSEHGYATTKSVGMLENVNLVPVYKPFAGCGKWYRPNGVLTYEIAEPLEVIPNTLEVRIAQ